MKRNQTPQSVDRLNTLRWAPLCVLAGAAVAVIVLGALGVRLFVSIGPHSSTYELTAFALAGVLVVLIYGALLLVTTITRMRQGARHDRYIRDLSQASETFTYVLDLDERRLVSCNRYLCDFIGYSEAAIVRGGLRLLRRLTHPDDWPAAVQHFADIASCRDSDVLEYEQRLRTAQGEWRWVLFRESVVERHADGTPRKSRGTGHDIHERKEVENALRQGREMLERVIDAAAVGMALVAPDGRFLRVNASLCEFLGYEGWELLESDFQAVTHSDDLDTDLEFVRRMLAGEIKTYSMEKRYLRKDGAAVWANLSVSLMRDANGDPLYFMSQVLDISERKSYEEVVHEYALLLERKTLELDAANRQLQHQAAMDPLTGLFNRRMLDIRLQDSLALAMRFDRPLAVILFDVDHFKRFNDQHGHVAGDEALRCVAGVVRGAARLSDVVARFGGEEFAIICPDTKLEDAALLAERLRKAVSDADLVPQAVTCSFGVAAVTAAIREPEALLEAADAALYRAKREGRNRVCLATGESDADEPAA